MTHPLLSARSLRLIVVCALATGAAYAQDNKWLQSAKPIGKATPTARLPTGNPRLPVYIVEQQTKPYHLINVSYVPRSHWSVKFEAGEVWTPWYCEIYPGTPPGQPTVPQRCIGIPKAQTVTLRVRLEGVGPKAGTTAYISGAQWAGACAGTAGDACTLVMSENHDVTAVTDAFN